MRCPNCGFDTTDLRSVLPVVIMLLQREGRVTYRSLKRDFDWDDAFLEDVREELAFKRMATEEDGKGLVWTGATPVLSSESQVLSSKDASASLIVSNAPPLSQDSALRTQHSSGERRQLTVMFCDLVGSTALSTQLDPEDLQEVVRNYQETAAAVLTQYEGHIAQYLGDGILAYFGYPRAHEDDAQRAVRAGVEIVTALQQPNVGARRRRAPTDLPITPPLQVRIGIHTGLVVVGEMGGGNRHEHLALGETPNVAARIQGLAEPDTVIISAATARLLHGTFTLEDLGLQNLKGIEEPVGVLRVLNLREGQRDEIETARNDANALVGREEEIGLLRRRWEQSKEGVGQVVLISGEAGIGKSALVEKIRADVQREGATRIIFRCSPYHQSSTLYPVIAHLQRLLDWQRNESAIDKLDKLERLLGTYQFPQKETTPLFATLLSLPPVDGRYAPLPLNPQQQKQQVLDALAAWLMEETERKPVLLTWEDLQWADPSSLELLKLIIDQAPTAAMLSVLTYRPDFLPPWPARSHLTPLTLNRLERPQAEVMITRLAGGKTLPPEVVQHIVQKTDGVPLFVEELTKMMLESGILKETDDQYQLNGPLSAVTIPATLQGSLMARLDRLPHVREVAQLGAVLGREFAYEMLKSLTTISEEQLQQQLVQLVEAELFYQRGRPPHAKYVFKHALLQDAAYASLLRSTRQHYHQQIAQLFEAQFPEMVETQPELVAYHYTKAERPEQALIYWQKAGERAVQLSANLEAIHHLTTGLELLSALPDTPEHAQRALDLHTAVGPAFMATKGLAAPEVEQTYNHVRALSLQLGETTRLAPALLGLSTFHLTRGEFQTARELGEQLLSLGQQQQDSALCVEAYSVLGTTVFH
ncbi:MAG: AAA family ATPase, partial [Deltaproteobacteria bacterium]|nr:AAA family ATPase [Deltaproteobacteria bacterium]